MNGRGAPGMVSAIVVEYHLSLLFMRSVGGGTGE